MNGPPIAAFTVYSDFFSYSGGVYHHTWGDLRAGHAVTIGEYDSNERYWIVKNSWGGEIRHRAAIPMPDSLIAGPPMQVAAEK